MKRLLTLFLLIVTCAHVWAEAPAMTIAPMLKKVMPAVVNVRVDGEIVIPAGLLPPAPNSTLRDQMAPRTQATRQMGSGVIIDAKNGYIITNAHVVKNQKSIIVTLSDSRHFPAKLIGADDSSDIAVLQILANNLVSLPVGDSNKLQVGDFVAAIGSPFGLNQTATSGIVSAVQRDDLNIEGLEDFIQTDAAINPGNSGGALVTFAGKLIGINTAIIAPGGGNVGIGFAIPSDMAMSVAQQLIKYGRVQRGLLGIFAQALTPDLAPAFNLPTNLQGAVVTSISPDSPAAAAGLQVGDVILSINDQAVQGPYQVRNLIGLLRVGSKVNIVLMRSGKKLSKSTVITDSAHQSEEMQASEPFLNGVTFSDINNIQSPLHGTINGGVQVLLVTPNTPADNAGLLPGDIIVSANQMPVKNISDLFAAAKQDKKRLLLNVIRGAGALFVVIQ